MKQYQPAWLGGAAAAAPHITRIEFRYSPDGRPQTSLAIMLVTVLRLEWPKPMQPDFILVCLLVALGAMIAYAADEHLSFTPRLAAWIDRVLSE